MISSNARANVSVRDLCIEIQKSKVTGHFESSKSKTSEGSIGAKEIIGYMFNPNDSIEVGEVLNGTLTRAKSLNGTESFSSRTILFSHRVTSVPAEENAAFNPKNAYWAINKMNRNYVSLKKEFDLSSCLSRAQEIGITNAELDTYLKLVKKMIVIRNNKIAMNISKRITEASLSYKNLEIHAADTYQDIEDFFKNNNEKNSESKINLILIFHGSADGFLVDQHGYSVPPYFLENLSSIKGLRSVTIFSCYPKAVLNTYQESLNVLAQRKIVLYFPINSGALSKISQVPVDMFPVFAKKQARIFNH